MDIRRGQEEDFRGEAMKDEELSDVALAKKYNWPPGSHPKIPFGYQEREQELLEQLADTRNQKRSAERDSESLRRKAWVKYHEIHGWPDDPGYRNE